MRQTRFASDGFGGTVSRHVTEVCPAGMAAGVVVTPATAGTGTALEWGTVMRAVMLSPCGLPSTSVNQCGPPPGAGGVSHHSFLGWEGTFLDLNILISWGAWGLGLAQ